MSSEDCSDDEDRVRGNLSGVDRFLFEGIDAADEAAVREALLSSANVNVVGYRNEMNGTTPLMEACSRDSDKIVRILLDAGADARWKDRNGRSAIFTACCWRRRLSIVKQLIHRDSTLLEITDNAGETPLSYAISKGNLPAILFLIERGANITATNSKGITKLTRSFRWIDLDMVRRMLDAGIEVETHDGMGRNALHYAVMEDTIEVVRDLILQNDANMLAKDKNGRTPFDSPRDTWNRNPALDNLFLEMYGRKSIVDHGRLALHAILSAAEYEFEVYHGFHPPLNTLRMILPLGRLHVKDWRHLLHSLDSTGQMIRSRDESGKLPIHIACRNTAPREILAGILELDPATLHMADHTGALPLHECCSGVIELCSVKFLVEQGGVGTLAARNREGALPLHILCGSANPPFQAVQYLIQSFPGSVSMRTNAGQLPCMIAAACGSSTAESLSVVYELVRTNPSLLGPR